jgi:hypothetical protein
MNTILVIVLCLNLQWRLHISVVLLKDSSEMPKLSFTTTAFIKKKRLIYVKLVYRDKGTGLHQQTHGTESLNNINLCT